MTNEFRSLSSVLNRTCLALLLAATVVDAPLSAQSLNIKAPTAIVPGENHGTIDNQVGSHYWSFRYEKGSANIGVSFTSVGLFGNPMAATVEIVLHNPDGKVFGTRSLTSNGRTARTDWPGTFGGPGTAIVELRTSGSALVRNGGDYSHHGNGRRGEFYRGARRWSGTDCGNLFGDGLRSRLRLPEQPGGPVSGRWHGDDHGWPQRDLEDLRPRLPDLLSGHGPGSLELETGVMR